jgi:hypothetical protein
MFTAMAQYTVWQEKDGNWYFGLPKAWVIVMDNGVKPAKSLEHAMTAAGVTRDDLFFESEETRRKFEGVFGTA